MALEGWGRVGCGLTPHTYGLPSLPGSSYSSFRTDLCSSNLPGALEWSPDFSYSYEICLSLR